jgi:hypothetical protein
MNMPSDDARIDAYLWDPAAPAADDVRVIERALAPLRFDAHRQRLTLPARPRGSGRSRRWIYGLAAAAVVVVIAGAWLAQTRWRWPDGHPWTIAAGPAGAPDRLAVGTPLQLSGSEEARIHVARIGTMSVMGDAHLILRSTGGSRHRLQLDRGSLRVRVWAPPGSVNVLTPAGEVIDLGCEFDLAVNAAGATTVSVRSGWVLIVNGSGETLVPAGAGSGMRADQRPGAPVFADASLAFAAAVRSLESRGPDPIADVDRILATARVRDVLTLLVLVQRESPGRERLAARAADLAPPPTDVTMTEVLRGDVGAVDRWRDTLPLPPPKGWLRNWRDGLPGWFVSR